MITFLTVVLAVYLCLNAMMSFISFVKLRKSEMYAVSLFDTALAMIMLFVFIKLMQLLGA